MGRVSIWMCYNSHFWVKSSPSYNFHEFPALLVGFEFLTTVNDFIVAIFFLLPCANPTGNSAIYLQFPLKTYRRHFCRVSFDGYVCVAQSSQDEVNGRVFISAIKKILKVSISHS